MKKEIDSALKAVTEAAIRIEEKVKNNNASWWTSKVKEAFGDLGLKKNYQVAASGYKKGFNKEWLWDLVWYDENEDGRLTKTILAMESEWGDFWEVKYDFEKLLASNAEIKVMVCESKPNVSEERLMNYFREAIESYTSGKSGEKFIIAILDGWDTWEFNTELIERP